MSPGAVMSASCTGFGAMAEGSALSLIPVSILAVEATRSILWARIVTNVDVVSPTRFDQRGARTDSPFFSR